VVTKGLTFAIATALAVGWSVPAAAQPADEPAPAADVIETTPPKKVKPLAVAASFIPGVLVAGSGHYVAGDKDTAKKLLKLQGYGLAMAVGAAIPLALTASARQISGPLIPLTVIGTSMWLIAWAADVYGTLGGPGLDGAPKAPRDFEVGAGYAYVSDPRFEYANFSVIEADLRLGSWRVSPSGWIAVDADNQRLRTEVGYRLTGPRPGDATLDGSFVDIDTAAMYHRYGDERFSVTTAEAAVNGRYDMKRMTPALGSAFLELGVGLGIDVTNYYTTDAGRDVSDLLLSRGAFGFYLPRGELRLGYDHRRDWIAGGFATPAQTNGFLGYFHVDGFYELSERWAVAGEIQLGSAYVGHLGVRYRGSK
jgi:hypothetical protein